MTQDLTAVIHIGTEKTGSTTLQQNLYNNKQYLLSQGVHYRNASSTIQNRDLVGACRYDVASDEFLKKQGVTTLREREHFRDKCIDQLDKDFRQLPSHVHTIIISSEHFHSRLHDVSMIERLRDWLSPYVSSFRIVCYLRRQVDLITSLYSTSLKTGNTPNFSKMTSGRLQPNRSYVNYDMLLGMWSEVFGDEAIDARLFDRSRLIGCSVVDDFLSIVNLTPTVLGSQVDDANESLSHLGQCLMRELNMASIGVTDKSQTHKVNQLRRLVSRAFAGKGEQMDADHAAVLQARFDTSNEVVRARWFPHESQLFSTEFENDNKRMLSADQEKVIGNVFSFISSAGQYTRRFDELDSYVDVLRETAKTIEQKSPRRAKSLLQLACDIRPSGPVINRKLEALTKQLAELDAEADRRID